MVNKVIINTERCKGCGLCVAVCPSKCIVIARCSNINGYFPAHASNINCTGCGMCSIICPETIIEVYKDSNILAIEPGKKSYRVSLGKKRV